jgi:hypothetical protein
VQTGVRPMIETFPLAKSERRVRPHDQTGKVRFSVQVREPMDERPAPRLGLAGGRSSIDLERRCPPPDRRGRGGPLASTLAKKRAFWRPRESDVKTREHGVANREKSKSRAGRRGRPTSCCLRPPAPRR